MGVPMPALIWTHLVMAKKFLPVFVFALTCFIAQHTFAPSCAAFTLVKPSPPEYLDPDNTTLGKFWLYPIQGSSLINSAIPNAVVMFYFML
eukprot:12356895-Ditylum_brightwellii.AAC.1